MTNRAYHFGLLFVVFGGFLSLNGGRFGGMDGFVAGSGLLVMVFGLLVGVLGLVDSPANESS